MDKNTIIGFALIGALIIGFSWLNQPSPEQIAEQQRLEQEHQKKLLDEQKAKESATLLPAVALAQSQALDSASLAALPEYRKPREDKSVVLKNSKVNLQIRSIGASPQFAEIKGFKNHKDGYENTNTPDVALFKQGDSYFNIALTLRNGHTLNTAECVFEVVESTDSTAVMRLPLSATSYLEYAYKLNTDDYRLQFDLRGQNLAEVLSMSTLPIEWNLKIPQQEQSHKFEAQYSSLYYAYDNGEVDDLSTQSRDDEQIAESLRWFAFKDKYFSSVLISNSGTFTSSNLAIEAQDEKSGYIHAMRMKTNASYQLGTPQSFTFYFGPNDYNILKSYDEGKAEKDELNLDHLVYLGWSVFRSINKWLIIPVVDFLKDYIGSWGIIILLLTVFIKTILFPFTYKSQISQAKMRVLKPQIDEINKKYEGKEGQDVMLKKQKETMALYSSAGASPMSGCLPMLLQMPFLIALYMYFPTSIYLRGQSFLWAADLSTYDPVISWDMNIPIISSFLGNHISLFCLLMTIVNIVYNRYMMSQSPTGNSDAMAGMKYMPYMMTVMFFFMFNQNASGLSYYYLISTLITIIQFFVIRATINEDKLLAQMEANKRKPKKNGNSFMERLERMQREQLEAQRKANKK